MKREVHKVYNLDSEQIDGCWEIGTVVGPRMPSLFDRTMRGEQGRGSRVLVFDAAHKPEDLKNELPNLRM